MASIQVTLKKSPIGRPQTQRRTLEALGLRKLNRSVVVADNPSNRGQIAKVSHLVVTEPVEG